MSADDSRRKPAEQASNNLKIIKTRLILGEGKDEKLFFEALLKHLQKDDVQVLTSGGKPGLEPTLKTLLRDDRWHEVEALLIVRDADFANEQSRESAARSAWTSVTNTLRRLGLPSPSKHGEVVRGASTTTDDPIRVGVFLLPDGESDGMLEDLCFQAVADDPVRSCIDAYLKCVNEKRVEAGRGPIAENKVPKARALAYLTSRDDPDKRVGEAAQAGYWPWSAPAFHPLRQFIESGFPTKERPSEG